MADLDDQVDLDEQVDAAPAAAPKAAATNLDDQVDLDTQVDKEPSAWEAGVAGTMSGIREIGDLPKALHPFHAEETTPGALDHLGELKSYGDLLKPSWWTYNMAKGIVGSSPALAAGFGGAAAGTAIAGPLGGLAGGAAGFGGMSALQAIHPAFLAAKARGLSDDDATEEAIEQSGIAGTFGAVMGAAGHIPFFGTALQQAGGDLVKVLKAPIKEALVQLGVLQPSLMMAQQMAATKRATGQWPTPEELAATGAQGVGVGAIFGAHQALRSGRKPGPTGAQGVDDETDLSGIIQPGGSPRPELPPDDQGGGPASPADQRAAATGDPTDNPLDRLVDDVTSGAPAPDVQPVPRATPGGGPAAVPDLPLGEHAEVEGEGSRGAAPIDPDGAAGPAATAADNAGVAPDGRSTAPANDNVSRETLPPDVAPLAPGGDTLVGVPLAEVPTDHLTDMVADLQKLGTPDASAMADHLTAHLASRAPPRSDNQTDSQAQIRRATDETDLTPTDGQKQAGNYRKPTIKVRGLSIRVENPKGTQRTGTGPDGTPWAVTMPGHYGYFEGTRGLDGDPIDVTVGDDAATANQVHIVDQVKDDGSADEHKVLMGYRSREAALQAYDASFSDGSGPRRRGFVTTLSVPEFKAWLAHGDTAHPVIEQHAEALRRRMGEMGLGDFGLDIKQQIADGTRNGQYWRKTIEIAADNPEGFKGWIETLGHEGVHAVWDVMSPSEKDIINRWADRIGLKDKRPEDGGRTLEEVYSEAYQATKARDPAKFRDMLRQEAFAHLVQDVVAGRRKLIGPLARAVERVKRIGQAIANWARDPLHLKSATTAEDLADHIGRAGFGRLIDKRAMSRGAKRNRGREDPATGDGVSVPAAQIRPVAWADIQEHQAIEAERLARADQQGYDVEKEYWHGSPTGGALLRSGAFDPGKVSDAGLFGPGIYLSTEPSEAAYYARAAQTGGQLDIAPHDREPRMFRVLPKMRDVLMAMRPYRGADLARLGLDHAGPAQTGEEIYKTLERQFGGDRAKVNAALQAAGFDGVYHTQSHIDKVSGRTRNLVVFDPARLRRVDAAFDPAKHDVNDLMASIRRDRPLDGIEARERPERFARLLPEEHVTVEDLGHMWDEIYAKQHGGQRGDPADTRTFNRVVNKMSDEVLYQLQQPITGEGWYAEGVSRAFDLTAKLVPELSDDPHLRVLHTAFLAATSYGTDPVINWREATLVTRHLLETNRVTSVNPIGGGNFSGAAGPSKAASLKILNHLYGQMGKEKLAEWLLTPHTVKEIRDLKGSVPGVVSRGGDLVAGKATDILLGSHILGPKAGPFMGNLNGIEGLTADRWMTRTFNRHFGRMTGPGTVGEQGISDAPRNQLERAQMLALAHRVAENIQTTPQQAQAVLWYFEQQLYDRLGVSSNPRTFAQGAQAYVDEEARRDAARDGRGSAERRRQGDADGRDDRLDEAQASVRREAEDAPSRPLTAPISARGLDHGPAGQHEIYSRFGRSDEARDTTANLKFYRLDPLIDEPARVQSLLGRYGANVKYFSFHVDPEAGVTFKLPRLKVDGYDKGTLWIYDPRVAAGSFKDTEYTRAWRVTHELGHGIVEPLITAKYGESKREGRLGRPMEITRGVPPKQIKTETRPLTLMEAQRAIEWEDVAFRTQRMILQGLGVEMTPEEFAKEYNTNIGDAVYRTLSGGFGDPGERGFEPSTQLPDVREVLRMVERAEQALAKEQGRAPTRGQDLDRWQPIPDEALHLGLVHGEQVGKVQPVPAKEAARLYGPQDKINRIADLAAERAEGGPNIRFQTLDGKTIPLASLRRDDIDRLGYYSALKRAITDLPLKSGSPEQWMGTIDNLVRVGVKREEVDWVGVKDWLGEQKGAVPKAKLLDYIRDNTVELKEIRKGSAKPDPDGFDGDEFDAEASRRFSMPYDELPEEHQEQVRRTVLGEGAGAAKFEQYSEPGGTNYREVLLQLPGKAHESVVAAAAAAEAAERARHETHDAWGIARRDHGMGSDQEFAASQAFEKAKRAHQSAKWAFDEARNAAPPGFIKEGHFYEPNVLAHARLKDRVSVGGKKLLAAEEIQSDWHQEGRRGGYSGASDRKTFDHSKFKASMRASGIEDALALHNAAMDDPAITDKAHIDAEIANGRHLAANATLIARASGLPHDHILRMASGQYPWHVVRIDLDGTGYTVGQGVNPAGAVRDYWLKRQVETGAVPDAPFKKSWPELVAKRLLREAIEKGHDAVAWTPGDMQNARWGLEKHIDRMTYYPETGNLRAYKGDRNSPVYSAQDVKPEDLAKHVGAEVAAKLLATPLRNDKTDKQYDHHRLEDQDLKVGGQGMRGFYDRILVDTFNKLGKRYGTRVEPIGVPDGGQDNLRLQGVHVIDDDDAAERPDARPRTVYGIMGDNGWHTDPVQAGFRDRATAELALARAKRHAEMFAEANAREWWHLPITPPMRDAVLNEGQPMFAIRRRLSALLGDRLNGHKDFLHGVYVDLAHNLAPMARPDASDTARAAVKDAANAEREAQAAWKQLDDYLKTTFTKDRQKAIWDALDAESTAATTGHDLRGTGLGIEGLSDNEGRVARHLDAYDVELWDRLKAANVVSGDRVPFWAPRMLVEVDPSGRYSRIAKDGSALDQGSGQGRNLVVSSPNLKRRLYLTSEETLAAWSGKNVKLVDNVRTLPLAMARLERVLAGRKLIENIRAIGRSLGREMVSDEAKPGFFTLDHPAFREWRPRRAVDENGKPAFTTSARMYGAVQRQTPHDGSDSRYRQVPKYVLDENGRPVMDQTTLHISNEFRGPLEAYLTKPSGATYQALMRMKAGATSVIMFSPAIHNAVEYGRAFPLMPGKMLTTKTYRVGNSERHDAQRLRLMIQEGVTPVGGRGYLREVSDLANDIEFGQPRSLPQKAAGLLFGDRGAEAVRKFGILWHEKLLWDRIADLQAGIWSIQRERYIAKGLDPQTAGRIAAHQANRFAGTLPREAMSDMARKIGNITLFSRTFTLGNLGVLKDMVTGLPKDVQAQILRDQGELARKAAVSAARATAVHAVVLDIALMYAMNALLQYGADKLINGKDDDKLAKEFGERWSLELAHLKEHPLDLLDPFSIAERLLPGGENETGRERRVHVGQDSNTAAWLYMRPALGKLGDEYLDWLHAPLQKLQAKFSTLLRPAYETLKNDQGFGRQVYTPANDVWGMAKAAGAIAAHFMKAQLPVQSIEGLDAMLTAPNGMKTSDVAKTIGPLLGFTFSQGARGGPAYGLYYEEMRRHTAEMQNVRPDIRRMFESGRTEEGRVAAQAAGMSPRSIAAMEALSQGEGRVAAGQLGSKELGQFRKFATPEANAKMDRLLGISP